jgi:hypothetical protein
MKPVDDCMIICLETVEENTEVKICFTLMDGDIIDWGDGTVDTSQYRTSLFSHIYTNIGHYIIKIPFSQDSVPFSSNLAYSSTTKPLIKHMYIPSWVGEIVGDVRGMTNLQTVTFARGVYFRDICEYFFSNCSSIENVILPNNITELPKHFFDVHNDDVCGIKKVVLPYGITSIPDYCFYECTNLTDIVIPYSVTSIGFCAFYKTGLTKFVVPNSVVEIGDYAFSNNDNLEELVISGNVTSLGKYIIDSCDNISKVVIQEGIKEIGDYTFATKSPDWKLLRTIVLPSTLTSIGSEAFAKQGGLKEVVLMFNSVCSLGNDAFNGIYIPGVSIYVPDSLVDSYKTAENWSAYASQIKPLSEYTGTI